MFDICETVTVDGVPQPFDDSRRAEAEDTLKKLSADGFRVLGVATLKVEKQDAYAVAAEHAMTLVGFAAFLDPPKEGVLAVLKALKQDGISVVVMTGDNQYVTQKIAHDVGWMPTEFLWATSSIRWTMPRWPTRRKTAPSSPVYPPNRRTG